MRSRRPFCCAASSPPLAVGDPILMASGICWYGDMIKRWLARVATFRGAPVHFALQGRSRYGTSRDVMLGITPSKIMEVTLMRPSHGNL